MVHPSPWSTLPWGLGVEFWLLEVLGVFGVGVVFGVVYPIVEDLLGCNSWE